MKTATTRKLEETSWLAQTIADKMEVESNKNGYTARWHCLHTLKWARYQGLNYRLDILVRPANQNELTMRIHNEYLIGG